MKKLKCGFVLVLILIVGNASSQSFEFAGTLTTTNENLFRNLPGISIGYTHHLKRQFIFIEFQVAQDKEYENTDVERLIFPQVPYNIKVMNGELLYSGFNLGIAQKLIVREGFDLSAGLKGGLNYYRLKGNSQYLNFNTIQNGTLTDEEINEKRNHKPGIGIFLETDLKQIIFSNLSLFSRAEYYHSGYIDKPVVFDDVPKINNLNMFGFRIGLRYRFDTGL